MGSILSTLINKIEMKIKIVIESTGTPKSGSNLISFLAVKSLVIVEIMYAGKATWVTILAIRRVDLSSNQPKALRP